MDELEDATRDTFVYKPIRRIFPHLSTESLPDIFEPALPFIHFDGEISATDLIHFTATFVSDVVNVIGLFSLAMYKFELNENVKIVDLDYTLPNKNFGVKYEKNRKNTRNFATSNV